MKKWALWLTLVIVLVSMAVPMAASADEQITLTILATVWPEYTANLERLADLYEAEHPNVTVETSCDGSTLTANIAAGNYPDILVTGQFSQLEIYKEYLGEITDNQTILSKVNQDSLVASTFDGKIYGFPVTTESDGLVYNKALLREAGFDAPPRTISELETLCETLKEMGVTPFACGFAESWIANHVLIYPFAGKADLQATTHQIADGEVQMADLDFCKDMQAYIDLMLENCNEKYFETDYTTMLALLASNQAAMCTNGSWVSDMVLEMNPDFELGIMGHPYSDDPADSLLNVTPSSCICYFKDAKNAEEAVKFIEWLVNSEAGIDWLANDFGVLTNVEGVMSDYDGLVLDTIAYMEAGETKLWGNTYMLNFDWDATYTSFQKYVFGDCSWDEMWNTIGGSIVANGAA